MGQEGMAHFNGSWGVTNFEVKKLKTIPNYHYGDYLTLYMNIVSFCIVGHYYGRDYYRELEENDFIKETIIAGGIVLKIICDQFM